MPNNQQIKTNLNTNWNSTNGTSYSTIPLLSGIKHKDQLEIERPFTTPSGVVLLQEDLRSIFVIPASNFEVDETNKKITTLTAPATYLTSNNVTVTIPAISNGDAIKIRRKSISSESLVSWVDGTRLTAGQLNLQSSQLLNLTQEILDRLKYEYVTSTDIDYNATYNSATRSWVESRLNVGNGTVKAYVDTADTTLTNSVNALNTKVGINATIDGASNSNVVTKLNYLEGLVGGQLFTNFPQHSIVIVGAGGTKNYSNNFTLTTGSPDVLALTGNQNLTGKLTVQGISTNDIISIKNSSGTEVNKIDQYGNIGRAVASNSQTNPIIGSLHFDSTTNNLSVYGNSGWQSAGTFNAPANQVTIDTVQEITHSKSFSANIGFGLSSNPLTIVDIKGTSGRTTFTGASTLGTTIRGSTATTDYSGIDLTGGTTGTGPKARIAALFEAGGSKLQLGTSNNYTNGITNTGLTIDNTGKVGILQTSPSFTLDVTGTGRFTGTVDLNDNTTINNNKNIRFLDSGNTARNSFKLSSSDKYQIGDIDNAIVGSDFEIYAKENIEFLTNGVEKARITSTGRLGIGTVSPSTVLHIVTNATSNTITQGDGSGTLAIGLNGSSSGSISHTGAAANNKLTISSDREIVLDGSNTTIASGRELNTNTIKSIGTTLQLQDNTAGNNVGIGTNAPSEKLEVSGNIKATAGSKIISDTIETGIIQSTGTIEFRQGYTANASADMTIDANGVVVFAQTPKVGNTAILAPSTPVVCQPSNAASGFKFKHADKYRHYMENNPNNTDEYGQYRLTYLLQGKVCFVYGVVENAGHSAGFPVDDYTTVNSGKGIASGLPIPSHREAFFTCMARGSIYDQTGNAETNGSSSIPLLLGGCVDKNGFLRIGNIVGSIMLPNTSSNSNTFNSLFSSTFTSASFQTINPNPQIFINSSYTSGGYGHKMWWNNTATSGQYIIFNFSYVTE